MAEVERPNMKGELTLNEKSIENRCRRQLARYGFALRKNRRTTGENIGGYMIVDNTNAIVDGYDGIYPYTLSLDDVAGWIASEAWRI